MDGLDLVDAQRGHGQGDQRSDLVAHLQVEAGLLQQVLTDVSDSADEHTAGTGDGVLLLAALGHDAKDHLADLLLVAAASLRDLSEGSGVNVQGDNVADDLVGVDLAHVVVDLPSSLSQNALGLDNAVGTVLVAFQFSHCNILLKCIYMVYFYVVYMVLYGLCGLYGDGKSDYFRGGRDRISRASAEVAISRPSSLARRTTLATSSPLDAAFWPLPR